MVIYCVAFGCQNEQDKRKISFHGFPFKRPEILKLWIKAVRRDNWAPSKTSKLCGEHFLPTDYIVKPGYTAKLLKLDAVPSVFSFPKHLLPKTAEPRRKIKELDVSVDVHNEDVRHNILSPMDINLPSTSSTQVGMLIDRETQTVSYTNKDILLRRRIKTLTQKVKRRDVQLSNMKDVIQSISKGGHSNENLDAVLKKHFEGSIAFHIMKEISITGRGLTTMCRLCLSRGETMLDVFRFSTRFKDKIVDVIMKCAPVQVLRYDEMPKFVCRKCLTKLEEMRQFQMQIIQSDKTLRRYLRQLHASDKEPLIEGSIQSSNDSLIANTNANIEYESSELHDVFDLNVNWREKECENFSSESKNNDEMFLKYEIKVEQTDKNAITLPDCADDPLEILSKGDEFTDINIGERKMETTLNFQSTCKSIEIKPEIKNEPTDEELIMNTENVSSNNYSDTEINNDNIKIDIDLISGNYSCETCNKCFVNSDDLKNHMCTVTGEKMIQCEICNRFISGYENFIKHKRIHTDAKPYQCDMCDKCFAQKPHLKDHKRVHTGEKPYKCNVCNKCFAHADSLKKHIRVHTGEKPYKCDMCIKSFSQSSHLKKHKRTHSGEKPHRCDVCGMCFTQPGNLVSHKRRHTGDRNYQCHICIKSFLKSSSWKSHMPVHTEEKPYQSDQSFTQASDLSKHKLSHAVEKTNEYSAINVGECKAEAPAIFKLETKSIEEIYLKSEIKDTPTYDDESIIQTESTVDTQNTTFNDCGSEINNDDIYIDLHSTSGNSACARSTDVQNIIENCEDNETSITLSQSVGTRRHSEDKLYPCKMCSKCFVNSDCLKKHVCTVTGEILIQCEICNRFFSGYENLIKHKRVHTDAKPYQCDICDKCFAQKAHLIVHKRTHTGEKPHQCNICNKCFALADTLKKHIRVHTGEKPYQCDICKKCFAFADSWKKHKRVHTENKPYQCDICMKCFVVDSYLQSHKRTHSGEKPYRCDVCNRGFTQQGNLVIHKRRHTGDRRYQCHICNKSFIESYSLKLHMRLHTGDKPYQCDVCDKCFTHAAGLSRHKVSHAGEKPNKYLDIDVGETKVEAPANFEPEIKSIDETNLKVEIKDTAIYDN